MISAFTVKEAQINRLKAEIRTADAIIIGAGAGLSASAGFTYSGSRFRQRVSIMGKLSVRLKSKSNPYVSTAISDVYLND